MDLATANVQAFKRVSGKVTREGESRPEYGAVLTSHSRGASGTVLGVGVDEASSISWRLRSQRLVGLVTRQLGGPSALRPSDGRSRRWGCVRTRDRATKPSRGSLWLAGTKAPLKRLDLATPHRKAIPGFTGLWPNGRGVRVQPRRADELGRELGGVVREAGRAVTREERRARGGV